MKTDHPHLYSRRILLAVTGLSPQIVTETLFALLQGESAFVPTEVRLITTREGAERARLALLSEEPGWFRRFCQDYALSGISFDETHIDILTDGNANPFEDIRNPEDNRRAADQICECLRVLTADPECALHVSLAGGRKTMGEYFEPQKSRINKAFAQALGEHAATRYQIHRTCLRGASRYTLALTAEQIEIRE